MFTYTKTKTKKTPAKTREDVWQAYALATLPSVVGKMPPITSASVAAKIADEMMEQEEIRRKNRPDQELDKCVDSYISSDFSSFDFALGWMMAAGFSSDEALDLASVAADRIESKSHS